MDDHIKQEIVDSYRNLFHVYGDTSEGVQMSEAGQFFRFNKLTEIAPLEGKRILDVGCGLGHFYPFLVKRFGSVVYTGIDIVPETVAYAKNKYPNARFFVHDITKTPLNELFDYVLMSVVFNNNICEASVFLEEMVKSAFAHCKCGLAFNFISKYANFHDSKMAYHDPVRVFNYCIDHLSKKIAMHHCYERADVAVFVYK